MEVRRHGWLPAAVAALALGAFAPAAGAATAQVTPDGADQVLQFTAGSGELNDLAVSAPHTGQADYMLTDRGAGITITPLDASCVAGATGSSVTCAPSGFDRIEIKLEDGADALFIYSADVPVKAEGGPGDDLFEDLEIATGTPARSFAGDEGDDYFVTSATGALPHDYQGGAGEQDTVDYAYRTGPQSITLDGVDDDGAPLEGDNVHSDIEKVLGGAGADTITGSAAVNWLVGNGGADTIQGMDGADKLEASGCDADVLDGGAGADTLALGGNTTAQGGPDGDQILSDTGVCAPGSKDDVHGGEGRDVADFSIVTGPLSVSLDDVVDGDGAGNDGWGGRDNFHSDIEDITGGAGGMVLIGSEFDNELVGGEGDDVLDGRGGNDQLRGGDGVGGDGIDTADYSSRTVALNLSNDGFDNDGDPAIGEHDGIWADVENLRGGSGDDTLLGNDAGNVLDGGLGADTIRGGAGVDAVDYFERVAGVTVTLNDDLANDGALAEGDNVHSDVEGAFGGLGNDTLVGNDTPVGNVEDGFLYGFEGNDKLTDRGGEDTLDAGSGNDEIDSVDGAADHDICGAGTDKVTSDASDSVDPDCTPDSEAPTDSPSSPSSPSSGSSPSSPSSPTSPVTPIDRVAPVASLSLSKGQRLRNLRSAGLKLSIRSNELGTLAGALTAESSTSRSLKRLGRPVKIVLAKGQATAVAGASKTLRLRLTRQGRRALRGFAAGKFKLVVTVTDRAGNKLTLTRHLRL